MLRRNYWRRHAFACGGNRTRDAPLGETALPLSYTVPRTVRRTDHRGHSDQLSFATPACRPCQEHEDEAALWAAFWNSGSPAGTRTYPLLSALPGTLLLDTHPDSFSGLSLGLAPHQAAALPISYGIQDRMITSPEMRIGAGDGIRTHDILLGKQVLYP